MPPQGKECVCQEYDQIAALFKEEVTYSDDSAPTTSEAVFFSGRPTVTIEGTKVVSNRAKPYWGNDPHQLANKFVGISGEIEVAGSGTAGDLPSYAPLLRACGLAETVDAGVDVEYAPASIGIPSLTSYFHEDLDLWKIFGMRGNVKLSMKAGEIPKWMFDLWGLFAIPANNALPAGLVYADADPRILNFNNTPTATFFGEDVHVDAFELDPGNVIAKRDKPGCYSVQIKNRAPSGSITICGPSITEQDIRGLANANTKGAISVVHGTVAGEILTTSLPNVQMDLSGITTTDLGDNEKGITIPFDPLPTSGDDEFLFTFS